VGGAVREHEECQLANHKGLLANSPPPLHTYSIDH
jgi:hypothetical protein